MSSLPQNRPLILSDDELSMDIPVGDSWEWHYHQRGDPVKAATHLSFSRSEDFEDWKERFGGQCSHLTGMRFHYLHPEHIEAVSGLQLRSLRHMEANSGQKHVKDMGDCFVRLFETEGFTFFQFSCREKQVFMGCADSLVKGLQSPKCQLKFLTLGRAYEAEKLLSETIVNYRLHSFKELEISDWYDAAAVACLCRAFSSPTCTIRYFRYNTYVKDDVSWSACVSAIANAIADPQCKLIKLRLHLESEVYESEEAVSHFIDSLGSPQCNLQILTLKIPSKFVLQKLCVAAATFKLKSLVIWAPPIAKWVPVLLMAPSLSHLAWNTFPSNKEFHVEDLLQAFNHPSFRLRHLYLRNTQVDNEEKLVAALQGNFQWPLETFTLTGGNSAWQSKGLGYYCRELLRRNKMYREGGLGNQQMVKPSSAKLFICGDSGVGKTTTRERLLQSPIISLCPCFTASTYGIDLRSLAFKDNQKLLLCDLAGQPEFHAFHHYFVRGSDKDLFLLICKAPQDGEENEFEGHLKYWLRFIVSHGTLSGTRPKVLVALNYFPNSINHSTMTEDAKNRCNTIMANYAQHLDCVEGNIVGFNAIKGSIKWLRHLLQKNLEDLLKGRPSIPKTCHDITERLTKGLRKKVASLQELKGICSIDNMDLLGATLVYLHEMGEVIYFEQASLDADNRLVILDPQWFLRDIIGLFLPRLARRWDRSKPRGTYAMSKDAATAKLAAKCEKAHIEYILNSLCELGVLLLNETDEEKQVKVLAFAPKKPKQWIVATDEAMKDATFMGRRFDCKDIRTTLLPSGIFAMIQVKLCKSGLFALSDVGEGWISLFKNGIQFIVEIGGMTREWYDRHWIDVLVRVPEESLLDAAEKLFQGVRSQIYQICGAPSWGCPSVELVEKVIRPRSVEDCCCNDASLLDDILEEATVEKDTLLFRHTWPANKDYTKIFELLWASEKKEFFDKNIKKLQHLAKEVDSFDGGVIGKYHFQEAGNHIEAVNFHDVHVHLNGMTDKFAERFDRLENLIKTLKSLKMQGDKILAKLVLRLESEWPKYPYFTDNKNVLQRISTRAFGATWRVHLLCEHGNCHPILNQLGIPISECPAWLKRAAPVIVPALRVMQFAFNVGTVATSTLVPIRLLGEMLNDIVRVGISGVIGSGIDVVEDKLKSQNWQNVSPSKDDLEHFNESFFKNMNNDTIARDFELFPVVTKKDQKKKWVCRDHKHDNAYQRYSD